MMWGTRARKDRPPNPSPDSGVPPLSRWERRGVKLVTLGGVGVGGLGFWASFDAVSAKALEWGFDQPAVLPIAIDSAIPVFTGAYLLLIRMDMRLWWARLVPWALSLITCALNVAAGTSLWAKVAHGSMSLLWVGVSEIAAHTYAVRIGAVTGRRRQMDKVRWSRWMLSPLPTFLLWRRMKLWELASYDTVLKLEQERLIYQAQLRARFGRAWRRKAPVQALLPLQLARTGVPLKETAAAGLAAAGVEDLGIFALPAPAVEAPKELTPASAVAVPVPAARAPRPQVTAAVPPAAAPVLPAPTPTPTPQGSQPVQVPAWSTEDELYSVIKWVIDNGYRDLFSPQGPLTGNVIAGVLGMSEGNGRKVRLRLIKTYAAERGINIPQGATVDQVFESFGHALTAATP